MVIRGYDVVQLVTDVFAHLQPLLPARNNDLQNMGWAIEMALIHAIVKGRIWGDKHDEGVLVTMQMTPKDLAALQLLVDYESAAIDFSMKALKNFPELPTLDSSHGYKVVAWRIVQRCKPLLQLMIVPPPRSSLAPLLVLLVGNGAGALK